MHRLVQLGAFHGYSKRAIAQAIVMDESLFNRVLTGQKKVPDRYRETMEKLAETWRLALLNEDWLMLPMDGSAEMWREPLRAMLKKGPEEADRGAWLALMASMVHRQGRSHEN